MNYSGSNLECIRFGARTGRESIGCCGVELLQAFVHNPDSKGVVTLMHGDSWSKMSSPLDSNQYAQFGPTNLDIFKGYLRIGTFGTSEVPNRVYLVTLTSSQVKSAVGKKWLKILKENGFEFIRTTANGVYSGSGTNEDFGDYNKTSHLIYIFGLFRNIGDERCADPMKAPDYWDSLPAGPTQAELHAKWRSEEVSWYLGEEKEAFTLAEFNEKKKKKKGGQAKKAAPTLAAAF